MKKLNIAKRLLMAVGVIFLASAVQSCTEKEGTKGGLKLSPDNLRFGTSANQSKDVTVSTTEWSIETGYPEWITAEKKDATTLTVKVAESTLPEERTGTVTIVSGTAKADLQVTQFGTETSKTLSFSTDIVTFGWMPAEKRLVDVITNAEGWEIDPDYPAWLGVTKFNNILQIMAEDNNSVYVRSGKITIHADYLSATITVNQAGNSSVYVEPNVAKPGQFISSDGQYVGGSHSAAAFVYNTQTEEVRWVGSAKGPWNPEANTGMVNFNDISGNGIIVGSCSFNSEGSQFPAYYDIDNAQMTQLTITGLPIHGTVSSGSADAISEDGTLIVGYVNVPNDGKNALRSYPVLWRNGVPEMLGYDADFFGEGNIVRFSAAFISDDGNTIGGYITDLSSKRMGCYWNLSDPQTFIVPFLDNPDFFRGYGHNNTNPNQLTRFARINSLSADGSIITGEIMDLTTSSTTYTPYSYNLRTGAHTILNTDDGLGTLTTPDGAIIYSSPAMSQLAFRDTFVYENGATYTLHDWFYEKYDLEIAEGLTIRAMSSNGMNYVGFTSNSVKALTLFYIIL